MACSDPTRTPIRQRVAVLVVAVTLAGGIATAEPLFHDIAAEVGIDFRHQDGRTGEKYYVETTASGGGWLDADGDGDLDLYLVNGAATPGSKLDPPPRNALYLQRNGRFVEVGERAGVADTAYGMGLCAGDVDADGRLDFLVTNYGPDRLYRNLGPGPDGVARFEEIGVAAGVAGQGWSVTCTFADLDGDHDLDLYVTHYVVFSYDKNPICNDPGTGRRFYCQPEDFDGSSDSLYINQGPGPDGTVVFREEGKSRGLAQGTSEKGMGVVASDLDDDGDLDLYVANDGALNRLYVNNGRGHFEDVALGSGAGLNALGVAEAGMGVDAADLDGDGLPELIVSHFAMETNTLYRNLGDFQFEDHTRRVGLGPISYKNVGWGIAFLDYDLDGDLDLAVANGHMQEGVETLEPGLSYRQTNQLLENLGEAGRGRFRDVSAEAGPAFAVAEVSRALAVGDFDDDGRPDLLITNTNAAPQVLANRLRNANHWLGLALEGPPSNPFAFGARVVIEAGGRRQQREVRSGGSFASQHDLRLLFGLGAHDGAVKITIRWPDGHRQLETTERLDRYWKLAYRKP